MKYVPWISWLVLLGFGCVAFSLLDVDDAASNLVWGILGWSGFVATFGTAIHINESWYQHSMKDIQSSHERFMALLERAYVSNREERPSTKNREGVQ